MFPPSWRIIFKRDSLSKLPDKLLGPVTPCVYCLKRITNKHYCPQGNKCSYSICCLCSTIYGLQRNRSISCRPLLSFFSYFACRSEHYYDVAALFFAICKSTTWSLAMASFLLCKRPNELCLHNFLSFSLSPFIFFFFFPRTLTFEFLDNRLWLLAARLWVFFLCYHLSS